MHITFIIKTRMAKRPGLPSSDSACCPPSDGEDGGLLRCACGSLLARRVPQGIELKCRRCKRTVLIVPLEEDAVAS